MSHDSSLDESPLDLPHQIDRHVQTKRHALIRRIMVWQDGQVIADRSYHKSTAQSRHFIKSIAKSIMSIATGIALDQGLIPSLDEPIARYIPEFGQNRDPNHRSITIRHLLTMTSGIYFNGGIHYHCPMLEQMHRSGNWISHIADVAVTSRPGKKFCYKEWDVILLAKVLDGACTDMYTFIERHLYAPLGISSEPWYRSPCGVCYSVASGDESKAESTSSLTAHDLLKIGRLFLDQGRHEGRQIVSSEYVTQATAASPCNPGYGFLWWRGDDWFGCRGYGGQNITVQPRKNAVFVMQSEPSPRSMSYLDTVDFCLGLV